MVQGTRIVSHCYISCPTLTADKSHVDLSNTAHGSISACF